VSGWWWALIVGVALVVALVLIGRRALGTDPTQLLLDPAVVAAAKEQAQSGHRADAVRTLRTGTPGLSLSAAVAMVDRMAAGPAQRPGSAAGSAVTPQAGPHAGPNAPTQATPHVGPGSTTPAAAPVASAPGAHGSDGPAHPVDGPTTGPDRRAAPVPQSADADPDHRPSASAVPLEIELEARALKSAGRIDAAADTVSGSTGWGLSDARAYVDDL
jgi:hypothetical protein